MQLVGKDWLSTKYFEMSLTKKMKGEEYFNLNTFKKKRHNQYCVN